MDILIYFLVGLVGGLAGSVIMLTFIQAVGALNQAVLRYQSKHKRSFSDTHHQAADLIAQNYAEQQASDQQPG